jgi:hypothetical protein
VYRSVVIQSRSAWRELRSLAMHALGGSLVGPLPKSERADFSRFPTQHPSHASIVCAFFFRADPRDSDVRVALSGRRDGALALPLWSKSQRSR